MVLKNISGNDYENALRNAKVAWSLYQETLRQFGAVECVGGDVKSTRTWAPVAQTEIVRKDFIIKYLKFVYEYALTHGRPLSRREMAKTISSVHTARIEMALQRNGLNHLDTLVQSGVWDSLGGEPLFELAGEGYASVNFPKVYFARATRENDVSYVPKLRKPDENAAELSGIILSSSGEIETAPTTLGMVVSRISFGNNLHPIYLRKHVMQLLSELFQVTEDYFNASLTGKIRVGSTMIGSYFQNVVGIFDTDFDGSPIKRAPKIDFNNLMKLGFIRGVLDCKGQFNDRYSVRMMLNWKKEDIVFEPLREYLSEFGIQMSDLRPVLGEARKLELIASKGPGVLFRGRVNRPSARSSILPSLGTRIYDRSDDKTTEIGEVVEVEEERPGQTFIIKANLIGHPKGNVYWTYQYGTSVLGGRNVIRDLVQLVIPKNPAKILQYLRGQGEFIGLNVNNTNLEEFIHGAWNGDLAALRERLHKEFGGMN